MNKRDPIEPSPERFSHRTEELRTSLLGEITAAREALGLTQAELAERAGVSRMTVLRAESPEAGASLWSFLLLALALNLTPVLRSEENKGLVPPPEDLVHRGVSFNRTKHEPTWRDRQREAALAEAWEAANEHRPVGVSAVLPLLVTEPTQAQATTAATVVQWLGSEVGFDFLKRALEAAGYDILDRGAPGTTGSSASRSRKARKAS